MDKESTNKPEAVCPSKLGLAEAREKLSRAKSGPQYWRSLEELAQSDGFFEMLHREFPRQASVLPEGASRRDFLKLMSASMALAGLSACVKQPLEPIVPYVRQPEEIVLGQPLFFASAMPFGAYSTPVLVESHEGRPTKVEGNPEHPAGLGGSDVFAQASLLDMYDPDRAQIVTYLCAIRTWSDYVSALKGPLNSQNAVQGSGLRILTRTVGSPTLASELNSVLQAYPQAKWVQYEPLTRDNVRAGAQMAFGQYVETRYNLEKADVILSLDGDFLSSGFPGFLYYARTFAARRNPDLHEKMSRFYSVQSTPTNTGGKADHRLPVKASEIEQVAHAVAAGLGAGGGGAAKPEHQKFVAAVVKDLEAHKGAAVVIPGDNQPASLHALAHAMNAALGAVGNTVFYTEPVEAKPQDQTAALKELVTDMEAGKVDLLLIMGANPVYESPADLPFADAMGKVPLRVQHGLYQNETSDHVHWFINGTHYLEQWGDGRAFDGTLTITQPLIAPLYDGKSEYEIVDYFKQRAAENALGYASFLGAGVYNQQTAIATSINAQTAMQFNQYMYLSQMETNQRYHQHLAAKKKLVNETAATVYNRLRNNPDPSDINSGDALNVVYDELSNPNVYAKVLKGAKATVQGSLIRDIPFQYATEAITTVSAFDPDLPAQSVTYSIVPVASGGAADAAKFQIDSNTGALSFIAPPT